jgi:hypothetical protein
MLTACELLFFTAAWLIGIFALWSFDAQDDSNAARQSIASTGELAIDGTSVLD